MNCCENGDVRGGRLLRLMLLLEEGRRLTAADLAAQLEVSVRTVLRDLGELSTAGVPVYASRGPGGGFQLLGSEGSDLPVRPAPRPPRGSRARVRVSPDGRRLAAVLDTVPPLRITTSAPHDGRGWALATFGYESVEGAAYAVLGLGPHVEVLAPPELRALVGRLTHEAAAHYPVP